MDTTIIDLAKLKMDTTIIDLAKLKAKVDALKVKNFIDAQPPGSWRDPTTGKLWPRERSARVEIIKHLDLPHLREWLQKKGFTVEDLVDSNPEFSRAELIDFIVKDVPS